MNQIPLVFVWFGRAAAFACYLSWCSIPGFAQPSTVLKVEIVDDVGNRVPARCWVENVGERLFQPTVPATCTPYDRDRSFSCDGSFEISISAGEWLIHVEKGKEYRSVDQRGSSIPGTVTQVQIQLDRWIDMPSRGFYSADMHVHFGQDRPEVLKQLSLADDVHLVPAFSYWLRGNEAEWHSAWPEATTAKDIQVDSQHLITRNNIEIERIGHDLPPGAALGATFVFGLQRPISSPVFGRHFPCDTMLCRQARIHSPQLVIDSDKPLWAETVIQAALGELDTIQLCHNHYHRTTTLQGGWGMIGPLVTGESNAAAGDALFHRTNAVYYRLLNCGFKLGVSGGSAIGVMPVPTGYNRVYAQIDGTFDAASYWSAIKSGRSFATSGPMLSLAAGTYSLGDTIERTADDLQPIPVVAQLQSCHAVEALEIIRDGMVVSTLDLRKRFDGTLLNESLGCDLQFNRSGWLAARALFRAPDGMLRQAHTSPIYVSVNQQPALIVDDVQYMLRWIDIFEDHLVEGKLISDPDEAATLKAVISEARDKYTAMIEVQQSNIGN